MLAPLRALDPSPPRVVVPAPLLAYVGLGGNLGDRLATLRSATHRLAAGAVPDTTLLRVSPVFETRPLGPSSCAFLNAVVELRTTLEPEALLAALLELEAEHGRTRRERWEARTLDLDVLALVGDKGALLLDTPRLTLPHPELERRDFALAPLAALRPDLRPRGGASVAELLAALDPGARTILAQFAGGLC